jgi:hypothetical protein
VQLGRELPDGLVEIQRGIVTGETVVARPVPRLTDGSLVEQER